MTSAGLRAGAVLLLVFAAGLLTGIVLERQRSAPGLAAMSPEEEHEAALAELREALELDDQQVAQLHAILAERQQIVQDAWERLRPELQSEMRQVHLEIADLLRPEQRQRFHDWLMDHGPASLIPRER